MLCFICDRQGEMHHIKTRGSGGPDEDWNLLPACRQHHAEIHAYGYSKFCKRYPAMYAELERRGFYFDDWGKLRRNILTKNQ